jgi:hypothetical protein
MFEGAEAPAEMALPSANDIHQFISANLSCWRRFCHAASHLDWFTYGF